MTSLSTFSINLPFDQTINPGTPDLNNDGLRDYITPTSWTINNSSPQPLVVALQEEFGSFSSTALRVNGEGGRLEARFARDVLWADFNGDGIVDLFPVDANESTVEYNGAWKWEGTYQYAYISQAQLTYDKVLISPIKISSHTAAIVSSAEGPPTIVNNALGNSLPDIPAMTISRYDAETKTFTTERVEYSDVRLAEGSLSPYGNGFFAIESLDVNNDGSDDLVCLSGWNGENLILINDGRSNFSYYKNFETGLAVGYVVEEVAKGDFNGDGLIDMLVLGIDRTDGMGQGSLFKTMRVLISDGETLVDKTDTWLGGFFQHRDSSFGYMEAFDFNGDGLSDIAFPHFESETSYQNKSIEILISTAKRFETNTFTNFADIRVSKLTESQMFGNDYRYVVETDIRGAAAPEVKSAYFDVMASDVSIELSDRLVRVVGEEFDMLVMRSISDRVKFIDVGRAFDLEGAAGKVAKILGAVFGADSVSNAEYVGIGLDLLDAGMSYTDLAALAINVTGNSSSTDICNLLWENVIGSPATSADIAPFKAMLDSGQLSVGQLVTLAADTSFNANNIDLVGLAITGLEYV